MSSNINIENLVEKSRFPSSVNETIGLIIYFPIGIILTVLRIFITINAIFLAFILGNYPNVCRALLRIMMGVLGLIVIEKDNSAPKNSRVLVSNYLSLFDHIALHLATGSFTPTKVFNGAVASYLGLVSSVPHENALSETIVLKQFISNDSDENTLLLFPEGAPTNGKCALLRFSTFPAVLSDTLQPVGITISRPLFANITVSVLGAKYLYEILWFFFVPFTKIEYKLLEVIKRSEDESNETLMSRVEIAISQELQISTSNLTKNDKNEYKKKYFLELAEKNRKQNKNVPLDNFEEDPEILRMAVQVSDVLPYVPQNVIIANLRRTRCIDITITNLLDGSIKYTPLPKSSKQLKPVSKKTAPNNFGVGSFMERKAKLIDEARQRYIKKHGLHHLVQ